MPIDFNDGNFTDEPFTLPTSMIRDAQPANQLLPSGHAFISLDALWVPPRANTLYVDLEEELLGSEEMSDVGVVHFARIINYVGRYIIDVEHINRFLTDVKEPPFQFQRLTESSAEEVEDTSVLVAGVIHTAELLARFNSILDREYGRAATLGAVEIAMPSEWGTKPTDED